MGKIMQRARMVKLLTDSELVGKGCRDYGKMTDAGLEQAYEDRFGTRVRVAGAAKVAAMKVEKNETKIPDGTSRNFETLRKAFGEGQACAMRARRKKDGRYVTLVCAMSRDGEDVTFAPFAVMLGEDGNPYDQFVPACDEEFEGGT